MCSIFGILDIKTGADALRPSALECSRLLRHRGPDWSGIYHSKNAILVHERLSIVDTEHGAQPLYNGDKSNVLAVNGEIYNHKALASTLNVDYEFQTASDCEVILPLYEEFGVEFVDKLQGMFAFIVYNEKDNSYLVARDHIGIIPLYTGYDSEGNFYVASEMKALMPICKTVEEFPPGHILDSRVGKLQRYYKRNWQEYGAIKDNTTSTIKIREALEESVKSHLMTDVPYGVLLSGGLDSSLISAITQKFAARRIEDNDLAEAWWPKVHSFACGLEGSPDLVAAQTVADSIGTIHHSVIFTEQEGIDALKEVIYHLETYDVTTIRASTPMYLMARKIKAMGIKMVLSGEGADEIFGGYLYFHKAPNAQEFHEELNRKLDRLHKFDCLRANKSMSAWGIEARVPFLDKHFMDVAMRINPEDKMCGNGKMEKAILRESFEGYLPKEILWRQKEQFSDGVGYSWIDGLRAHVESLVTDQQLENAHIRFPVNTPDNKEGYYYRTIFEEKYPLATAADCVIGGKSVACSTEEALAWDESFKDNADPSGRAVLSVHNESY
ncbi:asparagine synthase B [Colwellia psychrerythraea]|uniref:asparagine synthase (glutamine-hydrolyzing) n=1 Tax=Colwellia psychrerythraea TaxID=28229 RepID=A0A099KP40_COLPS|nr:asparagine synthase B [Colwellia psychrerythraea]KGJ91990.1 asparagine synthase (glutamine-hydrolyzing) [Colwellia psychrerythraea]